MSGTLFLLPALLGEANAEDLLPHMTLAAGRGLGYVLAENARSARALLKAIGHPLPIAQIRIVEIGHEPDDARIDDWLAPVFRDGVDAAVISEAGCPGVADPGATIVARAHALGIAVHPLVGPSSILLALMASGLNGQQFRFVGYLPREAGRLAQRLRELERDSLRGETQLFIETPYRNDRLYAAIVAACQPATRLSIAIDLTLPSQHIATRTVGEWAALTPQRRPSHDRHPAVFSLLAARAKTSGRQ